MGGPTRGQQEAPQAPGVLPAELEELRQQLAATREQLDRVIELMSPPVDPPT